MRLRQQKRDGKAIALFVLLLPALLGIVSLVVDVGIMLAMRRQAQSGADAAALAAARDLLSGSASTASATAQFTIGACSNLSTAQVQVNYPPSMGNFAGNSQYVEVIVTVPVNTYFIQVLSNQSQYVVQARAVAGIESVAPHEILTCLSAYAVPGMNIDGIALTVNGTVAVNSQGSGVDQNNTSINLGLGPSAVTLVNSGTLCSSNLRVVGGVDNPSSITAMSTSPALCAQMLPRTDPFLNLATPTTSTGVMEIYPDASGQNQASPMNLSLTLDAGQNVTLVPGIYASLQITGAGPGTVTFQPGVYVFQGGNSSGQSLWIDTGGTIVANGVLFYNTGSSYDPGTGKPDVGDGNSLGTESGTTFGQAQIKAGNLTLTGLADGGNPLNGMIYYQRRWNSQSVRIGSGASTSVIGGTTYARWATATLTMSGNWQGQIVVGNVTINGSAANSAASMTKGATYAKAPQVFLVE